MFIPQLPIAVELLAAISGWWFPSHEKERNQHSVDQHNLLKHLGGNGPYVPNTGFGIDYKELPARLQVDRVYLLSRHGERYPTTSQNKELKSTYDKLTQQAGERELHEPNPLGFVYNWEFYDESQIEMESNMSRYSGLQDMRNFGAAVRRRYDDLYDPKLLQPIFAASQKRVVDSAVAFAEGFTGLVNSSDVQMVIIPEREAQGVNTLTSGVHCPGWSAGGHYPEKYQPHVLTDEAERLKEMSRFELNWTDVYNLCTYCAYELNIRGHSSVCESISSDAFVEYEYVRDAALYYNEVDNDWVFPMGSVYVNATMTLLNQDDNRQPLWLSFAHDTDILFYLRALGVFDYQTSPLPTDAVDYARFFKSSEIIPMGARVVVERLNDSETGQKFVRLLVNDAVIPLKNCQDGPYMTCKLSTLTAQIANSIDAAPKYTDICAVSKDYPQYVSFYWDWQHGNYTGPPTS